MGMLGLVKRDEKHRSGMDSQVESGEESRALKAGLSTGARCSICKKPMVAKWRPFCSKRCANLDLGKWLSDGYVIAGQSADDEEDGLPGQENLNVRESE